ncbi:hypothetical protein LDENG_00136390 [Lucifuga dentata]|nr:hypothetical protein LDENG_00136390 [Lucifuga dentata]
MRENWDNPLAMSSNKQCQGQTDYYRQELHRLRADLEAENKRTQQALLCVELRHLREQAEREQQRALREVKARHRCQKDTDRHPKKLWHLLVQEVNVKDRGQYRKVQPTGKETFCLGSGKTYTKLKQLLLTLCEKINGEQAVYKLHHRQELELEKAFFLCHLLEPYGRLLQGRHRVGHSTYRFKRLLTNQTEEDSSNSCQTEPTLTSSKASLQRSQISCHSPRRTKQEQPLAGNFNCATAVLGDTCLSSSLKTCHPLSTPHAGWDDQPPCCSESSGSEESSPSKCMEKTMEEVRCFIFPNYTRGST